MFKQFGGKLPALSQFMVGFSHLLDYQWYIVIAFVGVMVTAFLWFKRSKWGRPHWDAFKLRIPLHIGQVVQKVAIARWSRTFSSLVSAGVPIMQAIEITGQTAGNVVIERSMTSVVASVKAGGAISEPLRQAKLFRPWWGI